MQILLTGSNGFIGKQLALHLQQNMGYSVRRLPEDTAEKRILPSSQWQEHMKGADSLIHLAARVHLMKDKSSDPLAAYQAVNTDSTINLATQAAESGIRRFIFISSIKVNGESSPSPYTENSPPAPQDPYAQSKWEAEQGLMKIAAQTAMEIVILRPPLVYGPNVKANFNRLLRLIAKDTPLPLGAIKNQRSLLYVGNLIDVIMKCIEHPKAANQTFLVADNETTSTANLIKKLSKNFNKPNRVFLIPEPILKLLFSLTGHSQDMERLFGNLTINNNRICKALEWHPPFTLDEGLSKTVLAFQERND